MTALETAKQLLAILAARLQRHNRANRARSLNRLFSTNAFKVYTLFRNCNQSVEQLDQPKKKTEMFWKGIWENNAS